MGFEGLENGRRFKPICKHSFWVEFGFWCSANLLLRFFGSINFLGLSVSYSLPSLVYKNRALETNNR